MEVAKLLRFGGTARRTVLGVEVDHYPATLVVGQFQLGVVAGAPFQGGNLLADLRHGVSCGAARASHGRGVEGGVPRRGRRRERRGRRSGRSRGSGDGSTDRKSVV